MQLLNNTVYWYNTLYALSLFLSILPSFFLPFFLSFFFFFFFLYLSNCFQIYM